jgi:hypothetical protein
MSMFNIVMSMFNIVHACGIRCDNVNIDVVARTKRKTTEENRKIRERVCVCVSVCVCVCVCVKCILHSHRVYMFSRTK